MGKLQLTGRNLGQVFNFRNDHVYVIFVMTVKLPNLKLITQHKQLLSSLPLDIGFPVVSLINFIKASLKVFRSKNKLAECEGTSSSTNLRTTLSAKLRMTLSTIIRMVLYTILRATKDQSYERPQAILRLTLSFIGRLA
jgi:hypothetical protein